MGQIKLRTIFFLFTFLISVLQIHSQDGNLDIVVYETYEDFKNQKGEYLGELTGYSSDPLNFKLRYKRPDGKKRSRAINKDWGFKVGDYYFRYKRGRWNSPMFIAGIKEKVFYYEGEFFLSSIGSFSGYGTANNAKNLVLYSDDLDSKFIKIKKFPKNEEGNPVFSELSPCIEKGVNRYGYSAQFDALTDCIGDFLKEEE